MNAGITHSLATMIISACALVAAESQRTETSHSASHTESTLQSSPDYSDAIKAALAGYQKDKRGYRINVKLGWLYYLSREYDKSQQHYRAAIRASRSSVEAKLGCMLPLLAQREYSKVEVLARDVKKTDRYNYYANLRLSFALRHQRKFAQAEIVARRMLRLYPSDTSFLIEKGFAQAGQHEMTESRKTFRAVLAISPDNRVAQYQLGSSTQAAQFRGTRSSSSSGRR